MKTGEFQSTRPIRGATSRPRKGRCYQVDFNPRAPYGARLDWTVSIWAAYPFQSTRPIRGATRSCSRSATPRPYFNPRAPYGARLRRQRRGAGGDRISIHAPHTGRDLRTTSSGGFALSFQSTRPIRGATNHVVAVLPVHPISIHAPHTGRDPALRQRFGPVSAISIHAPHTGRDCRPAQRNPSEPTFQSTRPIRGATAKMHNLCSAFLQ